MNRIVETYDITLRHAALGGSQGIGIRERVEIIRILNDIGITYIDVGTPDGSEEYARFWAAAQELPLDNSTLSAFLRVMDCAGPQVGTDPAVERVAALNTQVVCIEGECSEYIVRKQGGLRLEENLWRITALISWFRSRGKLVIFNARNYFDALSASAAYAQDVLKAAQSAGADRIVLCDSSGYSMFCDITAGIDVARIQQVRRFGIACRNSAGCADSNAIVAVKSGAMHIQGSFLGTGGGINLITIIVNLQVHLGYSCIPFMRLNRLTHSAEQVADQLDIALPPSTPYVGRQAFVAELPVIPKSRSANLSQPEALGNTRRSSRNTDRALDVLLERLNRIGYPITREQVLAVDAWREGGRGYQTEISQALRVLRALGRLRSPFCIDEVKILSEKIESCRYNRVSAVLTSTVDGQQRVTVGSGEETARALWAAVLLAVQDKVKNIQNLHIHSLRGRSMGSEYSAVCEVTNGERSWGVSALAGNEVGCLCGMFCDILDYHLLTQGYFQGREG